MSSSFNYKYSANYIKRQEFVLFLNFLYFYRNIFSRAKTYTFYKIILKRYTPILSKTKAVSLITFWVFWVHLFITFSTQAKDSLRYETDVRPLLQKHCIKCHNTNQPKAGVNIDNYKEHERVVKDGIFWLKVLDEIKTRSMPPRTEAALNSSDYEKLIGNIDNILQTSLKNQVPGQIVIRRLSHAEYQYTVEDLLGVKFQAGDFFPSDGSGGGGFDNQGRALFFTPLKLERYYEAAEIITDSLMNDPKRWEKIVDFRFKAGGLNGIKNWFLSFFSDDYEYLTDPNIAARRVIDPLATKAYRKFLRPEDKEKLLKLFSKSYAGMNKLQNPLRFDTAVAQVLKAILVSPNFLYKVEEEPISEEPNPLSHFEVANRLSYFLWCSMPDEELFKLAHESKLQDPTVLKNQVKRMLSDPKSKRFAGNFAVQWLGINKVAENQPLVSEELYPDFSMALRKDLYQEASEYFYHVLTQSKNMLDLLNSDYSIINPRLAKFYGVEGVNGEGFQKVIFKDRNRGGVLGMGAVLVSTSTSTRTSPVLRGKWVMEQLLGISPPPPPPEVAELTEDKGIHTKLGLRKILEMHRSKLECRGCHEKMDPLGLGLENYDPIGQWREKYEKVKIDASGVLDDGQKFNSPYELKQLLLKRERKIARNFANRILSYALGRSVIFTDEPVLIKMENALIENKFNPEPFLIELVTSYVFLKKIPDFEKKAV